VEKWKGETKRKLGVIFVIANFMFTKIFSDEKDSCGHKGKGRLPFSYDKLIAGNRIMVAMSPYCRCGKRIFYRLVWQ